MKRKILLFSIVVTFLLLLAPSNCDFFSKDCLEDYYDNAWTKAVELSGFDGIIIQKRPETRLIMMIWYDGKHRIYGESRLVLEFNDKEDLVYKEMIFVFLDVAEVFKLIEMIATHEYLHILWLRKSITDKSFMENNSDSEKWVISIFPDLPYKGKPYHLKNNRDYGVMKFHNEENMPSDRCNATR